MSNLYEDYFNEPNDNEGYVGYIYMTINLINGRKYIGQHHAGKFEPDTYLGSGDILKQAISKYGEENFEVILIGWYETEEDLNRAEKFWIDVYDAVKSPEFYNIAEGGQSGWGGHDDNNISRKYQYVLVHRDNNYKKIRIEYLSEYLESGWTRGMTNDHREYLSQLASSRVGEKASHYGHHHSEESKLKISRAKLGKPLSEEARKKLSEIKSGEGNPMYGKKHSEDSKQRIRESKLGVENPAVAESNRRRSGELSATYGTVRMNDGNINKCVPKELVEEYLHKGWKRGILCKKK